MLATLLSFLGGSAFRMLWGEISAAWTKYQDHKHELALLQVQAAMEAARHAQNLEAIRVQAELGVKTIAVQAEADIARTDADALFPRGHGCRPTWRCLRSAANTTRQCMSRQRCLALLERVSAVPRHSHVLCTLPPFPTLLFSVAD